MAKNVLLAALLACVGWLYVSPAIAHGSPTAQWDWVGPYQSTLKCEYARDQWPTSSQPCQQGPDGAYFYAVVRDFGSICPQCWDRTAG